MDAAKPLLPPPPELMFEPDTTPPREPTFARASQPALHQGAPPAAAERVVASESSIEAALVAAIDQHTAEHAAPEPVQPTITREYVQLVSAPAQDAAAPEAAPELEAAATEPSVEPESVAAQVVAIVTEDAEPIRVNERRDTAEAPPLVSALAAAPPIEVAPALAAVEASPAEPASDIVVAASEHADRIARQRGVTPIRVPTMSKRYDVVTPPRTSRSLILGAVVFGAICVAVTAGTIMWARGAVSRAEHAAQSPVAPLPAQAATSAAPVAAAIDEPAGEPPAAEAPVVVMPEAQPAVASCSVSVTANVRGAQVFLDGKRHGTAPAVIAAPCNTAAVVEVRHARYEDFKQQLTIDGALEIDARLERYKTTLTVWSDPPGAQVTYNGSVLGKTPLVAKVNRYEAGTLWFRAPGRTPDWRKIVPKQQTKTVSITLKPGS